MVEARLLLRPSSSSSRAVPVLDFGGRSSGGGEAGSHGGEVRSGDEEADPFSF
jgi:hypothetical protein